MVELWAWCASLATAECRLRFAGNRCGVNSYKFKKKNNSYTHVDDTVNDSRTNVLKQRNPDVIKNTKTRNVRDNVERRAHLFLGFEYEIDFGAITSVPYSVYYSTIFQPTVVVKRGDFVFFLTQ